MPFRDLVDFALEVLLPGIVLAIVIVVLVSLVVWYLL